MTADVAHVPVMLSEVLVMLQPRAGAVYVDATFGRGGYTQGLLDAGCCRVIAIDRDPAAIAFAAPLVAASRGRLTLLRGRFGDMVDLLSAIGVARIDGVAFDLGVSSGQIDDAERGFSFRAEGPLDMRMDPDAGETAGDLVNALSEAELARILRDYGEERAARRIARAIVRARLRQPIASTADLAGIVHSVLPRASDGIDPATRTFQALRIRVNDELGELARGLAAAERLLGEGGRLCVVAFHSLEDRVVKVFLKARAGLMPRPSRHQPWAAGEPAAPSFRLITLKAVRPLASEVAGNPRARSARLRAAERTGAPVWPAPQSARRAA
jgi:16S rRNA (cytosine1402-N4)-methyltransferase